MGRGAGAGSEGGRAAIARLSIPEPLLLEVMNYLANRPYREVAGLLAAVQKEVEPVVTRAMGMGPAG